jgi:hypothetical protein
MEIKKKTSIKDQKTYTDWEEARREGAEGVLEDLLEQFSDSSSSSESHITDRSFPVSPSILYEQREMFIDMRCKSNYKSVTLSSIKSCHKKEETKK